MKEGITYESLYLQKDIEAVMLACSTDFFEQSNNTPERIKELSQKFSKFAQVVSAKYESEIVGFIAFYNNDRINYSGFLSMLIVKNQFQGYGVGSMLLELCIEQCKKGGMTTLRLEVNRENARAIHLYEKIGFKEVEKSEDSIFLEKKL